MPASREHRGRDRGDVPSIDECHPAVAHGSVEDALLLHDRCVDQRALHQQLRLEDRVRDVRPAQLVLALRVPAGQVDGRLGIGAERAHLDEQLDAVPPRGLDDVRLLLHVVGIRLAEQEDPVRALDCRPDGEAVRQVAGERLDASEPRQPLRIAPERAHFLAPRCEQAHHFAAYRAGGEGGAGPEQEARAEDPAHVVPVHQPAGRDLA